MDLIWTGERACYLPTSKGINLVLCEVAVRSRLLGRYLRLFENRGTTFQPS